MATGKQAGEFSLKATTLTFTPSPGRSVLAQGNFEGTSAAFGTILRTATFVSAGAKSGTYSECAAALLETGESLTGNGQGTFESIGRHKWRLQELIHIPDGRSFTVESEMDFATRSGTGQLFEKS